MGGRLFNANRVISAAQMELGITQRPVSTVTNTLDQDISQMLALMATVADDLLLEEPYATTLGDGVWCIDKDGVQKEQPSTDTDLILMDGRLMINGLKYRFLKAKGLEYGEELRDYTNRMNKLAGRVNGRVLDLDADEGREA
jgi:hypothetical protein